VTAASVSDLVAKVERAVEANEQAKRRWRRRRKWRRPARRRRFDDGRGDGRDEGHASDGEQVMATLPDLMPVLPELLLAVGAHGAPDGRRVRRRALDAGRHQAWRRR
jgi:hypothetical protein